MNRRLRHRWIAAAALAGAIFGPGLCYWAGLRWKRVTLEHRLRQLTAAHQRLEIEQERLTADPVYVEGLIRSTFKVAKPGELVVPIPSDHRQ